MELPLLSSLTVAFLKVSGEVHFATPIVFHGTVVPSQTVTRTLDFLESSLKESEPNTADWRQFRTAKQFIVDAFALNGRSNFVTVGQVTTGNTSSRPRPLSEVFNWPVQMQGPILLPPQLEASTYGGENSDFQTMMSAGYIESFASKGDLVGFGIGHLSKIVDFAVVSPSSFIPRFKLESSNDAYDLDQDLAIGHVTNRVDLGGSDAAGENATVKGIKLIADPLMDNVIHFTTPNQIISVSTNTTRIASNKVREHGSPEVVGGGGDRRVFSPVSRRSDLRPKTTAWSCLDATFFQGRQNPIVGAVISDDVQLGHIMVVRLANGNMIAINLTETRHLRELANFAEPDQALAIQSAGQAESQALTALDQTEALTDIVQPLIRDVIKGIGGLTQVGGSDTKQEDVTSDVLAGFIGIENKCKKEIFLPLMTMNEHVSARKKELKMESAKNKELSRAVKEMIAGLREKQNIIKEKTEIMIENSKSLADRSASVLQSSKDLFPSITQAEYDYFQELKRLDEKTNIWEYQVERLARKIASLNDSIAAANPAPLNLSPQYLQNAGQLLNASGHLLNKYEKNLIMSEDNLDGLAAVAGFTPDPHP